MLHNDRRFQEGEHTCMKKKVSLLLAIAMLFSAIGIPAFAEEPVIKESVSGFYYIEENGEQARLSVKDQAKLIQADGLYFKDMNGNGALDVYEDYRKPVEERVSDLLSQMTLDEKAGTLIFACIAGSNGSTVTNFNADATGFSDSTTSTKVISAEHPGITTMEPTVVIDNGTFVPTKYQIQEMNVTTYIAALTGTAKDQLNLFNGLQAMAEDTRLGIPVVFSGDRSYDTWGGQIDMAHYAFGVAHDADLLYDLVSEYAKEAVAIGYHQVFHGYGNEIGSWYGDEVNYIAEMAATETHAYDDNGFNSHSKHFIARGGRNSYTAARSPADLIDSWMVGWKAVVDAGTQWIMTNNNVGVTGNTLQTYMDKDTYTLLRDDLGYEGIICLDWPLDIQRLMGMTGTTSDGVDVSTLSAVERYALILNTGIDMFSCYGAMPGTDIEAYSECSNRSFPALIVEAVNQGLVTAEDLDVHVGRVLKNKFDLGIFEDPYSDWEAALELIGSDAYKAADGDIIPLDNETINTLRRSEITEMEEKLMVESTVLFKNDSILPLAEGTKVYVDSNNSNIKNADTTALAAKGTVVETIEEADVIVYHTASFDENFDYIVEDAQAADKPIVLIFEGTVGRNGAQGEPYWAQVEPCAAVLMQTYNNTPDHGSSIGAFYRYVTPSVTADMLFGAKEPAGSTVFEVPFEVEDLNIAWGELQMDIGVDNATRLYMAMMAKANPTIVMPNNLGDVMFTTDYGMSYSKPADIELSLLTVPQKSESVTTETNGRVRTTVTVFNAPQKAGVPFELNFVAQNNGEGDGHITAQVKDGDSVIAEKFVALDAGQFRVFTIELTLEAGEHVISVGDMSTTIVVE